MSLLEVYKKKKRWYLVFEFVDHTVLDDLEAFPNGLDYSRVRKYLFQIVRGTAFCHSHNVSTGEKAALRVTSSQQTWPMLPAFGQGQMFKHNKWCLNTPTEHRRRNT